MVGRPATPLGRKFLRTLPQSLAFFDHFLEYASDGRFGDPRVIRKGAMPGPSGAPTLLGTVREVCGMIRSVSVRVLRGGRGGFVAFFIALRGNREHLLREYLERKEARERGLRCLNLWKYKDLPNMCVQRGGNGLPKIHSLFKVSKRPCCKQPSICPESERIVARKRVRCSCSNVIKRVKRVTLPSSFRAIPLRWFTSLSVARSTGSSQRSFADHLDDVVGRSTVQHL